jgi:hypothetical protein
VKGMPVHLAAEHHLHDQESFLDGLLVFDNIIMQLPKNSCSGKY